MYHLLSFMYKRYHHNMLIGTTRANCKILLVIIDICNFLKYKMRIGWDCKLRWYQLLKIKFCLQMIHTV